MVEASTTIWKHLEASAAIWDHLEACRAMLKHLEAHRRAQAAAKSAQEAAKGILEASGGGISDNRTTSRTECKNKSLKFSTSQKDFAGTLDYAYIVTAAPALGETHALNL